MRAAVLRASGTTSREGDRHLSAVRRWHAELAWLPGRGVHAGVLIEAAGRHFSAVTPGVAPADCPPETARLAGFTMPGLANAHSHAFHRALRGVVQAGQGTFWTWRERMYQVAGRLQPDSYLALARAVYAEMALAGITCVGEFHYLHHDTGGARYADPNEMGRVLIEAAAQAGLRITLLDTCYLRGGLSPDGSPAELSDVQRRFSDGDGARWAERAGQLRPDGTRVIAVVHMTIALEQVNDGEIGRGFAVGHGGTLQDPPALEVVRVDELIDEAGLSDPGLPDQGYHLPVSGPRPFQSLDQGRQLCVAADEASEPAGRGRLQAPPDATRADQLKDVYRRGDALDRHGAQRGDLHVPLGQTQRRLGQQNRARQGHLLHAGGEVGGLAHRCVIRVEIADRKSVV